MEQVLDWEFVALEKETFTVLGKGFVRSQLQSRFPGKLVISGGAWNHFLALRSVKPNESRIIG